MTPFQCLPIPTETARRFRLTGLDDNGNQVRPSVTTEGTGSPCRYCLQFGKLGEAMILGSYNLPRPRGIYWTPSPIFVHARDCPGFTTQDEVAPIIAGGSLVSVRAYDAADQCIYELGKGCAGLAVHEPLHRGLADARTAFINVHTARPGCLLARVERRH